MSGILDKLGSYGVIPVTVLNQAESARPLAEALCNGGLPCAEITFRTAAAEESIRIISRSFPDMLVGAGTVLTIEQVDRAVSAGARYIVSPGFDPEIVDYCISKEIPVIPGCMTPSEVAQGVKRGLKLLKFFPAEQAGGPAMIKALAAPYTMVKFIPTGGVNRGNMEQYLALSKVAACGGSWMVKADLIDGKDFDRIEELTREAVEAVRNLRSQIGRKG
ncbi:bifunctional 4-hydroxy-2-oxoglutarate aldolase/2-dehydro-3-deoxy-phosphogluconate aldolase [Lachnospiraceae bacterium 62-35]